jgi:hypothetical protein
MSVKVREPWHRSQSLAIVDERKNCAIEESEYADEMFVQYQRERILLR